MKALSEELEQLRSDPQRAGPSSHSEIKVVNIIVELSHREEMMWRRRSRIKELCGSSTSEPVSGGGKIELSSRPDEQLTKNYDEMGESVSAFYKALYTAKGTTDMNHVLQIVPTKVTSVMNEKLLAAFDKDEVRVALFQMFPTKAPGPDGMLAHFFSNGTGNYCSFVSFKGRG